jgi:hypothetical protein
VVGWVSARNDGALFVGHGTDDFGILLGVGGDSRYRQQ